jgi:carboxymethylenebutenolidase
MSPSNGGDKGTPITAYVARPSGPGPFPGVVLVHHLPGWSEFYIETTRRFAHHGHLAICANLYEREGGGSDGNPDDVAAKVRAEGGIADSQMVGDTEAAVKWIGAQPGHNGKVGLIGSCSGARHAFIYACQRKDIDACVEQWGGRVVMGKEELNPKTPVAPIDMTKGHCHVWMTPADQGLFFGVAGVVGAVMSSAGPCHANVSAHPVVG